MDKRTYESLAAFRFMLRHFLRYSEERSRAAGLTPQQYQLLLAVVGQPDRDWATIKELAEALQIGHSAAVGLVDRCVDAGLVYRLPGKLDRREVRIQLTERGGRCVETIAAGNLQELQELLRALQALFAGTTTNIWQAEKIVQALEEANQIIIDSDTV